MIRYVLASREERKEDALAAVLGSELVWDTCKEAKVARETSYGCLGLYEIVASSRQISRSADVPHLINVSTKGLLQRIKSIAKVHESLDHAESSVRNFTLHLHKARIYPVLQIIDKDSKPARVVYENPYQRE